MSHILESPSAERNKGPIFDNVISPIILPRLLNNQSNSNSLKVLELAAGCGVHTTHFTSSILAAHPSIHLEWTPSDPDIEAQSSINARVQRDGLTKVVQQANGWALGNQGGTACNDGIRDRGNAGSNNSRGTSGKPLDYSGHHKYFDLVLCINMIHIAPWEATLGLMECCGKVLRPGGILMCYGPYKVDGTAVESNLKFDASLKAKDSSWGVRDLEDVVKVANVHGLSFVEKVEMPANNLSVLFCKKFK
jgi:SAM-dependent methyltransferase